MKQLIKIFKQLTILLLAITFIGCCEDDDVILPEVVAGFTYTLNSDTGKVTFINISENANNYTWSFGDQDGTTSNLNNPDFTYAIGAYTVVLTATNVAGASDTFEDTIILLDEEIPLITLIGDATIHVTLGDTFTDPGATAHDEVDGDLTANIVVGGDTVDTNVEGTYVITYDVSDSQGNEAIQVERTVIVTAISCTAETEGSLSASNLNLTFLNDPTASIINDGATFSWIDNPDFDNTVNASCKVGQITKLGNNPWDNNQIDLDAKLDFNANEGLKIKVWSPLANTEVRIKLEEIGNAGNNVEQFLTTSVIGAWEELTFPFTSADSNKFNKIVIFFDLNANNTDTYYFDDLKLYGTGSGGGECVAETEENNTAAGLNMTFMSDISSSIINDNATFTWADNPDSDNAVNSSCKVAQVTKGGINPWDNIQIDLDAKIDLVANGGLKVNVFSAQPGYTMLLKLEEIGNPDNNVEIDLTTTQTNAWEELTFGFNESFTNNFDKIVIIFDLNEAASTNTYYFDNLKLFERTGGGGGGGDYNLTLPIDFENDGFGANWSWNVFENEDNPPLEFVANPSASGINTSSQVAKITARQAGAPWVGTETAHGEMGITWDLSASNAIIKIMVYKTVISDVGIKLVNPAGGAQGEIKVPNTVTNQWEELTFDFSDRIGNGLDGSTNIDQIVVFPDFTNPDGSEPRAQDNVVYFDNITFN